MAGIITPRYRKETAKAWGLGCVGIAYSLGRTAFEVVRDNTAGHTSHYRHHSIHATGQVTLRLIESAPLPENVTDITQYTAQDAEHHEPIVA